MRRVGRNTHDRACPVGHVLLPPIRRGRIRRGPNVSRGRGTIGIGIRVIGAVGAHSHDGIALVGVHPHRNVLRHAVHIHNLGGDPNGVERGDRRSVDGRGIRGRVDSGR